MTRRVVEEGTKRFTKRTKVVYGLTGDDEAVKATMASLPSIIGNTPSEYVQHCHNSVVSILKESGLPYRSPMWKHRTHGWTMEKPDKADFKGFCTLEVFVSERQRNGIKDFPYDSTVGLAASVVTLASRILAEEGEHRIELAVQLGGKLQALKAYLIERKSGRKAPRRKKYPWAVGLAERLIQQNPKHSFEKAWRTIPTAPQEVDDQNIYRCSEEGKEFVTAQNDVDGRDEKLTKETFRTKYFSPVKKRVGP